MKRTTSLTAAVAAAAIIATPVAGTSSAAVAPASVAAVTSTSQAAALPLLESFAPDPLKVLALPFSNFDLIRTSAFVITGYKKNAAGQYVNDENEPLRAKNPGETDAAYVEWISENGGVPVRTNIFTAISDSVNNFALKGDFATAAAQIQNYLSQLAAQVVALPAALIKHNVDAFFPSSGSSATITAQRAAAPTAAANPFALPDAGALLTVAGIPLKNLDQALQTTFVSTGYKKNADGLYLKKGGGTIPKQTDEQTDEEYAQILADEGVVNKVNIFQAVSDAVNKQALKGDFSGAATAIQGYLTELAGNVVKLPGDILTYDLQAIGAVVPGLPTPTASASDTSAATISVKDTGTRTPAPRGKVLAGATNGDGGDSASGVQTGATGSDSAAPTGSPDAKGGGRDLIGTMRDLLDGPDKSGADKDKESSKPEAPTAEPDSPTEEETGAEQSGDAK